MLSVKTQDNKDEEERSEGEVPTLFHSLHVGGYRKHNACVCSKQKRRSANALKNRFASPLRSEQTSESETSFAR